MAAPQILKHMMPRDIPLFASYIFTPEGNNYTNWEFDVLVGDPEDPGAHYPMSSRKAALYQNSLKVDAIGWLFGTPTIIEVKPNAGCGAIGQVLTYQKWYRMIFDLEPRMMIVCNRMSRQIQTACIIDNIDFRILQPASDYQIMRAIDFVKPKIKVMSVLPSYQAVS